MTDSIERGKWKILFDVKRNRQISLITSSLRLAKEIASEAEGAERGAEEGEEEEGEEEEGEGGDDEWGEGDEEDEGDDVHTDSHSMRAYAVNETMEPLHSGKLSSVAEDACCRWFMDALKQAKRGDPNQAALVSQMMLEGYGCNADPKEARYWAHVARNAGARRIEGVYDELP